MRALFMATLFIASVVSVPTLAEAEKKKTDPIEHLKSLSQSQQKLIDELETTKKLIESTNSDAKKCFARDFPKAIRQVKQYAEDQIKDFSEKKKRELNTAIAKNQQEQNKIREALNTSIQKAFKMNVTIPKMGRFSGWDANKVISGVIGNLVEDFLMEVRSEEGLKKIQAHVDLAEAFMKTQDKTNKKFAENAKKLGLSGSDPMIDTNRLVGFLISDISKRWFHEDKGEVSNGKESRSFKLVSEIERDKGSVKLTSISKSDWDNFIRQFTNASKDAGGTGVARFVALEEDTTRLRGIIDSINNRKHPTIVAILTKRDRDVSSLNTCQMQIRQANGKIHELVPHVGFPNTSGGLGNNTRETLRKAGEVFRGSVKTHDGILKQGGDWVPPKGRPKAPMVP